MIWQTILGAFKAIVPSVQSLLLRYLDNKRVRKLAIAEKEIKQRKWANRLDKCLTLLIRRKSATKPKDDIHRRR